MKISVIIPASGAGTRLGGSIPKQFLHLNGEPILRRTLGIFDMLGNCYEGSTDRNINEQSASCLECVEIAVAVPEEYLATVAEYDLATPLHIIPGGKTRAESVYSALQAISPYTEIVLIHDGIRPFVTPETIRAVAQAAATYGAAIAATPVIDTIKQADAQGKITSTPARSTLWQAQTPQGFTYEIVTRAYAAAYADGILSTATDDASLAERLNIPVHIVPSPPTNIKITTQTDLSLAEILMNKQ